MSTSIVQPLPLLDAIAAIEKSKQATELIAQTIASDQSAADAQRAKVTALDAATAADTATQATLTAGYVADLNAGKAAIDAVLQSLQPVPAAGVKP